MKWKSATSESEALDAPDGRVQLRPLSTERAIVPRSEISQPTLPSARNWSRYRETVSLSAAAQDLPPSAVRTDVPSSAIARPSRLSKNQMLLKVASATPPALRRFQLAPPSMLSQVLPNSSARTKRSALNARKPLRIWTPGGLGTAVHVAPLSWVRSTALSLTAMTVVGSARRNVSMPPLAGGCTTCHAAPPSAVRLRVRRVMKLVGSEGSRRPDSKPIASACMASTNSMSSE